MNDKVVELKLFSPHDCDFTHMRPDGTTYIAEVRKDKPTNVYTPEKQLDIFEGNYEGPLYSKHPDLYESNTTETTG